MKSINNMKERENNIQNNVSNPRYRLQKDNLEIGYNIVFIWNKNANILNNTYKNVNEDITNLFNKAGIIK